MNIIYVIFILLPEKFPNVWNNLLRTAVVSFCSAIWFYSILNNIFYVYVFMDKFIYWSIEEIQHCSFCNHTLSLRFTIHKQLAWCTSFHCSASWFSLSFVIEHYMQNRWILHTLQCPIFHGSFSCGAHSESRLLSYEPMLNPKNYQSCVAGSYPNATEF
jgi:hypothetical protein